MQGNSRSVSTNQPGISDKLEGLVLKHLTTENKKPVQAHTQDAFERVERWRTQSSSKAIILDSCCGVGESTWRLAHQYPKHLVIGVDKSAVRIKKHGTQQQFFEASDDNTATTPEAASNPQLPQNTLFSAHNNYCVVRADVIDFWRLVAQNHWPVAQHYIFYPNPYPKASQVQKRWHATASFKDIINIGGNLTVRSNWKIYIQEFAKALQVAEHSPSVTAVEHIEPFTPFERKYWNSGQRSWQVNCQL